MGQRLGMVMWCHAKVGEGWAYLPLSSRSKIEVEEEEQQRKGCPRECALRAHAPSRAGWWPPVEKVRFRDARSGEISRVEHTVPVDAESADLRARIGRSLPSALWQGRAGGQPKRIGQGRLKAGKEDPPHTRHRRWLIDIHLGRPSYAIRRPRHSTTAPAPAGAPLIALVRLATGWKNPATQSPRASRRRPGSGIRAQRLQLAHGSARAPARCQRGADVGALDRQGLEAI